MTDKGTEIEVRKGDTQQLIPNAMNLRVLATDLFNSKMFRGIDTVPQAIAVMQCGAELGVPPVQSLTNIKPIKGQMTMSAKLIMGLAIQAGVTWKILENTAKRCEIEFFRKGWEPIKSSFTIEEAQKAGLVRSDSGWEKWAPDMLFARAGTRGIRRIAPDASISKIYSTEEMMDDPNAPEPINTTVVEDPAENSSATQSEGLFPGDEIADMAHTAEDDAATQGNDPELEAAIQAIKDKLLVEGVDLGVFKEWLFKFQNTSRPVKYYIGKIGKSYRFHLGKKPDVIQLSQVEWMDKAIGRFRGIGEVSK